MTTETRARVRVRRSLRRLLAFTLVLGSGVAAADLVSATPAARPVLAAETTAAATEPTKAVVPPAVPAEEVPEPAVVEPAPAEVEVEAPAPEPTPTTARPAPVPPTTARPAPAPPTSVRPAPSAAPAVEPTPAPTVVAAAPPVEAPRPISAGDRCAAAKATLSIALPYDIRCVSTSYPTGWTIEQGRAPGHSRVGQCVCEPGKVYWIEVDASLSISRLAFTIAHEVGHAHAAMHGGPWTSEDYADDFAVCAVTGSSTCG